MFALVISCSAVGCGTSSYQLPKNILKTQNP